MEAWLGNSVNEKKYGEEQTDRLTRNTDTIQHA